MGAVWVLPNVLLLQMVVGYISEAPGNNQVWNFRGSEPIALFCISHWVLLLKHAVDFREMPAHEQLCRRSMFEPDMDETTDLTSGKPTAFEEVWRHTVQLEPFILEGDKRSNQNLCFSKY